MKLVLPLMVYKLKTSYNSLNKMVFSYPSLFLIIYALHRMHMHNFLCWQLSIDYLSHFFLLLGYCCSHSPPLMLMTVHDYSDIF